MTSSTATKRFVGYTLKNTSGQGLLPEGDVLVMDLDQGILTQLHAGQIVEAVLLSPSEMYVIDALLRSYPDYCPHEVILSAMTGRKLEDCREKVLWGLDEGTIDVVMRPVRNLLGRCRMKLKPFGIEIKALVHMGYLLVARKRKQAYR